MKNQFRLSALLPLLYCIVVTAREMRTPMSMYQGPIHFQLFHAYENPYENDTCITGDIWMGLFSKEAAQSYTCNQGLCKTGLAYEYFNATSFRLAQAVSSTTTVPANPFVNISTINLDIDYQDRGAYFGGQIDGHFGCEKRWHSGLRVRVPYRDIIVENNNGGGISAFGETLDDVYENRLETITINGTTASIPAFAARLDFLSSLSRIGFTSTGSKTPLVVYVDPNNNNNISIAGQNITGTVDNLTGIPSVAAIESTNSTIPFAVRWANLPSTTAPINADGSGLANLQRGRFVTGTDYSALGDDIGQQDQLFIVPSIYDNGSVIKTAGATNIIRSAIESSIATIPTSVQPFLVSNGIDFSTAKTKGIGDMDFEVYLGYDWRDRLWSEIEFGVKAPTGTRICNPLQLLKQATGNNKHTEVRLGGAFAYGPCDYFHIKADIAYSWVLNAVEQVCGSFQGQVIKNIGPVVNANVKWQYFIGHIDFVFTSPCFPRSGLDIGYEIYDKTKDKISFCQKSATDFLGVTRPLDASVLERNTKRISHKFRTELFGHYGCGTVFVGFTQVFAGQNAPRDTDMHIGIDLFY